MQELLQHCPKLWEHTSRSWSRLQFIGVLASRNMSTCREEPWRSVKTLSQFVKQQLPRACFPMPRNTHIWKTSRSLLYIEGQGTSTRLEGLCEKFGTWIQHQARVNGHRHGDCPSMPSIWKSFREDRVLESASRQTKSMMITFRLLLAKSKPQICNHAIAMIAETFQILALYVIAQWQFSSFSEAVLNCLAMWSIQCA